MLHACFFDGDEDGLLVDVPDVAAAEAAALEEVKRKPLRIVPLAMGMGWRFGWVDDDEDPDVDLLEFEPLDHVPALIAALEQEPVPLAIAAAPQCTSEADGPNGETLRCELDVHATPEHRSGDFTW